MEAQRAKRAGMEALRTFGKAGDDLGEMSEAVPALTTYAKEFGAPDFACTLHSMPPTPPMEHPGVDGIGRAISDWSETFTSVRATLEEVVELENAMVLLVNQVGITRHDGVEVSQPSAMVFKLVDGMLARLELHLDRDEALRSAGEPPS